MKMAKTKNHLKIVRALGYKTELMLWISKDPTSENISIRRKKKKQSFTFQHRH